MARRRILDRYFYELCETLLALKNRGIASEEEIADINEEFKKKDRYEFSEEDQEPLTM